MRYGNMIATPDPKMPIHHCIVKVDAKIVYTGRLGKPVIPFLVDGCELLLHPIDFVDGSEFQKKHR